MAVPPQYNGLKEISIEAVRARLRLLYHFSDLMYSSWRLLNLSPNNQVKAKNRDAFSSERICTKRYNTKRASSSAELHVALQRRYLGDRSGPAEAAAGSQSVHAAHGALHRKDDGAGQKLRPADHCETDLHTVSTPQDFV